LKDFGEFDPALGAYNMSAHEQTRMYGIELGFALIGCYAAGSIGARFGRKIGLALTAIVCILGPAIQMISHVPALLVGRAFLGLGAGSAAVLAIAYWSEVATPALRGRVVMFYQLFINLASFVGACINQGTYKKRTSLAYRIPLIVGVIVPVFLLILIWLVPESPREFG
jgi:MFS family permease